MTTVGCGGGGETTTADSLDVGNCVDMPLTGETVVKNAVDVVSCDRPHSGEVIGVITNPAAKGAPYPGLGKFTVVNDESCLQSFHTFVSGELQDSDLQLFSLEPSEDSWKNANDRATICVLTAKNGRPMSGSQRDKGSTTSRPPSSDTSSGKGSQVNGEEKSTNSLEVGDCWDLPSDARVVAVRVMPCAVPHDREVFAVIDPPAGPYLGDTEFEKFVKVECVKKFTPYAGVDLMKSDYNSSALRPDHAQWEAGDRRIICILSKFPAGKLTGSAKA
jgi:hypothetical protein